MKAAHPCVGDVRSIGLFSVIELVRDKATKEPLAPFNGTSPEMQQFSAFFREHGLYTMVRWNAFYTNPPLTITEGELREGFDIIDKALEIGYSYEQLAGVLNRPTPEAARLAARRALLRLAEVMDTKPETK